MLYFFIFFVSCTNKKHASARLGIVMSYAESYEINFIKKQYIVFFDGKPPKTVNFEISNKELNEIKEEYYSLNINSIKSTNFTSKCQVTQSGVVVLKIEENLTYKQIKIDISCNESLSSDAYRVNRFIKSLDKIIKSKKKVQEAPFSNIFYDD